MRDTTFDNTCQGGDGMEERRLPAVEAAQKSSPRVSTSALDSREGSRSYFMRSRSGFWRVPQHYPGDGLGPSPGTGAGDIYPPGVFSCLGQQTTRITRRAWGGAAAIISAVATYTPIGASWGSRPVGP